jgi:hypothetical protein
MALAGSTASATSSVLCGPRPVNITRHHTGVQRLGRRADCPLRAVQDLDIGAFGSGSDF